MKRLTTLTALSALSLAMGTTRAEAGVMMYFDFNSAAGSTVADLSGNGQDGTLNGTSTLSTDGGGHTGLAGDKALSFFEENFFTTTSTVSPGTGDFAVSFWYKINGGSTIAMADHSQSPDNTQGYQLFANPSGGQLAVWDSTPDNSGIVTTQGLDSDDLNNDQWHHIAFSVDRTTTNTVKVYVNGNETDSQSTAALINPINFGLLQIGTFNNGQVDSIGFIDDYAIFDTALSQADVIAIRDGAPILPGGVTGDFDGDGDGDVDGVDVATMFSNFNGPGGGVPGNPDTDLDNDGDCDGVDVANLFGLFTGPLAPATVPEPTSLALLGLLAMSLSNRGGLALVRRRR